jgi:hypothetical protein
MPVKSTAISACTAEKKRIRIFKLPPLRQLKERLSASSSESIRTVGPAGIPAGPRA